MFHGLVQSKNVVECLDLIPDEEQKDQGYLVMEKYSHTLGQLLTQREEDLLDEHGQPVAWFKEVSLPHCLSCTCWHMSLQEAALKHGSHAGRPLHQIQCM